jgi:hypothetical protein
MKLKRYIKIRDVPSSTSAVLSITTQPSAKNWVVVITKEFLMQHEQFSTFKNENIIKSWLLTSVRNLIMYFLKIILHKFCI